MKFSKMVYEKKAARISMMFHLASTHYVSFSYIHKKNKTKLNENRFQQFSHIMKFNVIQFSE